MTFRLKDLSSSEDEDEMTSPTRVSVVTNLALTSEENLDEIELDTYSNERSVSVTPCVGCFLTHNRRYTPHVFENYLRLLHSIPKSIIFLRIRHARIPYVKKDQRLLIKLYGHIYHISVTFGYAETRKQSIYEDILLLAKELYRIPIPANESDITFFTSNQTIDISKKGWRSYFNRWPLYIYSIQKSLIGGGNINIRINPKNTIQIGTIAEL